MSEIPQHASRIPLRADPGPKTSLSLQKELPRTPSPSKPRYLRLNHKVLSTIFESSADASKDLERKARWSIRPVNQDDEERSEGVSARTEALEQPEVEQERPSLDSSSYSPKSRPSMSLTSTEPTSIEDHQSSSTSCTVVDYKDAYTQYRVLSLQSRKLAAATNLRHAMDKTQFLVNQLHISTAPFNLLLTILHHITGSSSALRDLQKQITSQHITTNRQTEEFRAAVRDLLITNQSLIRECEVLLKETTASPLDLFTKERLAVNRLMKAIASEEHAKVGVDDDLLAQTDTLVTFNEYVGTLVQSLEFQNVGLESLIGDVNRKIRLLEEEVNSFVRDNKSLRKMIRKMFQS
ncbi:hypothetical protein D6D29_10656 [Aureobasidium pullulans]|nr:hypothetical protein D6D29_10656 [Aureobasidium pullulans]